MLCRVFLLSACDFLLRFDWQIRLIAFISKHNALMFFLSEREHYIQLNIYIIYSEAKTSSLTWYCHLHEFLPFLIVHNYPGSQILQQAWPFIGQYLEKLLLETIAPSIRAASAHLRTLSFTKVDLGDRVYKSISDKRLSYLHTFLIFEFDSQFLFITAISWKCRPLTKKFKEMFILYFIF